MWNDETFWFTQMIFYKQQEQYVLITYSQGNQALFDENAGKQCVTM